MTFDKRLIGYLDQVLQPERFADAAPNGLQVPGRSEVRTVVTGVSAHVELLEEAAALGADLVLVHHGFFWKADPRHVTPQLKRRLQVLFAHDMGLAAYHLPLDAHPEHGNNVLLARALGAEPEGGPFEGVGCVARFPEPLDPTTFVARVREACEGREPLAFLEGPAEVRTVGIVTGAAPDGVLAAAEAGLDAYLTGEPAERLMANARELGVHALAAGHHATERFGVRRLGELLQAEFGVGHRFVDVPNPI